MKKNTLRYVIDVLLFVDMCAIAIIGLMLKFIIPAGRAASSAKYFLGLHRHQWGDLHLYFSLVLLVLLIVHVWFNWAWFMNTTRRFFGAKAKYFLGFVPLAWVVLLGGGWFLMR